MWLWTDIFSAFSELLCTLREISKRWCNNDMDQLSFCSGESMWRSPIGIMHHAHFRLTCWKQGRIVRRPVQGFKVNRIITISFMQMFLLLCFAYIVIFETQTEGAAEKKDRTTKLQTSNHNSTFSWINLIGLWTTRPRSYAFRLT